jgi:pimeloyl-ACP methyl ester carboxylesterase
MREVFVPGRGGVNLRVAEHGDRSRPPVVLLHGLGLDGDDWSAVGPVLAADHWVLCPDARGHGRSDQAHEYSFGLMRDDVLAMLDELGITETAIVGSSMGGTVAFSLIAAYPDRVTRLVTVDTPPPRVGWKPMSEPPDEPPEDWTVNFHWPLLRAISKDFNDIDPTWWDDLSKVNVPTLVIGGGSTSHVDQSDLADMAALIPDCRLVTFEGAGHHVHGTMPDEFLSVVQPFLRGEEIPSA